MTSASTATAPCVFVEQGELRGKQNVDWKGHQYYSFQGIPYAKPPIDELRFKAPQPPSPWTGVRNATVEGNISVQRVGSEIVGDEDCLYLNVYTKELPTNESILKPVMFWIHGGGFVTGSGNALMHSPDFLIAEDVVLVTFNYRLGLLGYLSAEDPILGIPGNAGCKDMIMALKWVQKNISNFNGDPNNVTIFGCSSGGASAHLMMVSPMSKGLFHKSIAQSGCALSAWATTVRRIEKFAEVLGARPRDEREALTFLEMMPANLLVEAVDKVRNLEDKLSFRVIGPVVEHNSDEQAFLIEEPEKTLQNGTFHKVPLMIGFTSADAMLYLLGSWRDPLIPIDFTNAEVLVPKDMNLLQGSPKSKEIGDMIKQFYYGNETPSRNNLKNYVKMNTDIRFALVTKKAIKLQQDVSTAPIYLYRFAVDIPFNVYKKLMQFTLPGAAHGDEMSYLFKTKYTSEIPSGSIEEKTIQRMVKLWTNFAKTSNPTPESNDNVINVKWEPIEKNKLNYINLDTHLSAGENPNSESMAFWDDLYKKIEN